MGNNAQHISNTFPAGIKFPPGKTIEVSVTFRNTGTTTWSAANLYRIGFQDPQDNMNFGVGRVDVPHDVAPNEMVTFTFNITVQSTDKELRCRMVQDGVEWFGDLSPDNIVVKVKSSSDYDLLEYFKRSNSNYGKTLTLISGDYYGSGDLVGYYQYKYLTGDIDFVEVQRASGEFAYYMYSQNDESIRIVCDCLGTRPCHYSDGAWMRRYWQVGEEWNASGNICSEYNASTKQLESDHENPWSWPMRVVFNSAGTSNLGGNIGTVDWVVIDYYWSDGSIERNTFAKNWGRMKWEFIPAQGQQIPHLGPARWLNYSSSTTKPSVNLDKISPGHAVPGPYWTAEDGGQGDVLPDIGTTSDSSSSWERFYITKISTGVYAIKTMSGWHISAENCGGGDVNTKWNNGTPDTWEKFTFIRQSDGYYAIQCYDGVHYLNAPNGGGEPIDATATSIGTNQKFGLHEVSSGIYVIWTKNYVAFGPEFSSMPTLTTLT